MPPPDTEQTRWFATEVQPHRPALRAWLLARFPTLPDVDDLVQESLARMLRAREAGPIGSARALLFTTARNLALDAVRRQRVVRFEPITDETPSSVLADGTDVAETVSKQQELELLTKAIQSLPERSPPGLHLADRLRLDPETDRRATGRLPQHRGKTNDAGHPALRPVLCRRRPLKHEYRALSESA
jgi:hypothetical protein